MLFVRRFLLFNLELKLDCEFSNLDFSEDSCAICSLFCEVGFGINEYLELNERCSSVASFWSLLRFVIEFCVQCSFADSSPET